MSKTKKLTLCALLVALDIICTRLFFFFTPGNVDRLSLQFLPNAVAGMVLSPLAAALVTVCADLLGMLLNSAGQTFTPFFTLSAAVRGVLYSLVLRGREITVKRAFLASLCVTLVVDIGMNPFWISMLYDTPYSAVLLAKLPVRAVWVFVQAAVIYFVGRPVKRQLDKTMPGGKI